VERSGRRLRRRRRLARAAAGTASALLVAVAGAALYVERRDAAIDRVDVATPPPAADGAVNVLLLGVDPPVDGGQRRADAIVVLRLEADGEARLLSIPRDMVMARGEPRMSVLAGAGPAGAADAVTALTGIPLDHVVQLDSNGFAALVDAVGGISIRVDWPLVDDRTGLHLDASACTTLDGATALALVRSRHVENDDSGDFGRQLRQRALLEAALAQTGGRDVDAISRVLADHATVDAGLDLPTLVALGRRLDGARIVQTSQLYGDTVTDDDGAQVLLPSDVAYAVAEFGVADPSREIRLGPADPAPGIGPCA
jgi:LCP family protein required for cell wall assembly